MRSATAALILLLAAPPAGAADPSAAPAASAQLSYSRGEGTAGCPDEPTLRDAVAARLGYDPFRPDAATTVSAVLSRDGRGLRARVELRDRDGRVAGSRVLTSAHNDCRELASAMALAICIAVDPFVLSRPPPSACPACPACPSCPACPPPNAPAPPPRTPIRFRVGAGLQAGLGATPSLGSLGVTVQAELRRRVFGFGLEGRIDPRLGSASATVGGVGATLLMAVVVPCARWRWLGFCALGGVGALQGTGVGVSAPRQATTFYAAVGARIAAEIPLGRVLALELHLDGLATLTRTRLQLDGGEVWVTPPLSGALGAMLQVRFP